MDDYYKPLLGGGKDFRLSERYPEFSIHAGDRYPPTENYYYSDEPNLFPVKDYYLYEDKFKNDHKTRYPSSNSQYHSRERYPGEKQMINENKITLRRPYYTDNIENYPAYTPQRISRYPLYRRQLINIFPAAQHQRLRDYFPTQANIHYSPGHIKNIRRYPIDDLPNKDLFFKRVR